MPSAEGSGTLSEKESANLGHHNSSEDMSVDNFILPSLPDFLEELDNLDNFSYLEELAESLLEDAQNFADVESSESSKNAEVVGQASKNVESNRATPNDCHDNTLKKCNPPISSEHVLRSAQFQELFDQMATSVSVKEEVMDCITVIIPSDESHDSTIFLEEAVEEVVTSEEMQEMHSVQPIIEEMEETVQPTSPLSDAENLKTDSYSDYGYESLDSPHSDISSDVSMTNMWTENFSNLFPNLV